MPTRESASRARPGHPLPLRPYLRSDVAVIARPRQPLTIAGSARHVVHVVSPPTGLADWLASLDGAVALGEAVAAAPLPADQAGYLLGELRRAGLLGDANAGRAFSDPAAGQRDALDQAARARDGSIPRRTEGSPTPVAVRGGDTWAQPLRAGLGSCPAHVRLTAEPDAVLVVSITTAFAADPDARGRMWAEGAAHLAVVISAYDALLSPLSIPGRTACPTCWSLHTDARHHDWRDWTVGGRPPRPPRLPAHHRALVTAVAVEHILTAAAVLRGEAVPELAALERSVDLRAGTVSCRSVSPHPACGCCRAAA